MKMTLRYTTFFILLCAITGLVDRYDTWLRLPPASIHQWRQADGAAMAWQYAQHPDFFEVKLFNLAAVGDAHAVGELPVLYWFSGLITHYIGWPVYPLRWIGLLLLLAGLWTFGWVILCLTRRPAIAALGAGILFTAPILAYYGPSFMPDAPAFCMVLLLGGCLLRADQRQSIWWLGLAALCAAVAMMLKISMAIVPLALIGGWLSGRWQRQWLKTSIWSDKWPIIAISGVFIAVLGCRWWIAEYNAAHQATYFFAAIRPIWRYDWPALIGIVKGIGTFTLPAYASVGLYMAALTSIGLWLQYRQSVSYIWRKSVFFVALGCLLYVLLWFRMLREHDYYAICLLAFPAILLPMGIWLAVQRYAQKTVLYALLGCWLMGLGHSHYLLNKRLEAAFNPKNTLTLPPDAFLSDGELTSAGIPAAARFLCPEDPSPNIALLALQRYGWSAYNFGDRITGDTLTKYSTRYGLTHLALRDTADYNALYQQFFSVRVGVVEGWYLYGR